MSVSSEWPWAGGRVAGRTPCPSTEQYNWVQVVRPYFLLALFDGDAPHRWTQASCTMRRGGFPFFLKPLGVVCTVVLDA